MINEYILYAGGDVILAMVQQKSDWAGDLAGSNLSYNQL